MRLRTDSAHSAGWHRALVLGGLERKPDGNYAMTEETPVAESGDVWVTRDRKNGPIVGYALTCPEVKCDAGVHVWGHAWDCRPDARKCDGSGCWTWTGSPEDGTLTAFPSLHVLVERGGCGWHGWLRNGEMVLA